MAVVCLTNCPECSRHVRCGETMCPFCHADIAFYLQVNDYRLRTPLGRGKMLSLAAALVAAGISVDCEPSAVPLYGGPFPSPESSTGGFGGAAAGSGSLAGYSATSAPSAGEGGEAGRDGGSGEGDEQP